MCCERGGEVQAYSTFTDGRRWPLELGNLPGPSSVVGIQGLRLPPAYPASPAYIGDTCVAGLVGASVLEHWLDRDDKRGQCGAAGLSK